MTALRRRSKSRRPPGVLPDPLTHPDDRRRTMKRTLLKTLLAVAVVALAGTASAQTKLKWAHVYETSEPYHTESVWAAEEIKKRTNGKFEIQVFPASSLGKETDINQGMQLGTVDMIISGPSFAARSYPRLGIAYYPFIFRDGDHLLAYSKSDVFKEMIDGFREKTGIQILAYTYYGARHTTSQKPFTDCVGMKGLKIRVPDVPAYRATPEACGANPTPIAFAEVYLALQNGTVDAQENPLTTIEAKKFYEVQKAIMLTGHIVDGLTTQVAPHVWSKLTDAEKKIFSDVALEAAARASAQIKKREAELVDEFKKKGLTIVAVNRQSFIDAVLKAKSVESMGFDRKDYDRIVAVK
jgi:tripartite ATP-independent transporter DctP family solute receptor